jgi:type 1 glutamine amidotransferase
MLFRAKTTRRTIFKAGLASIAAATITVPQSNAAIRPKAKGEIKVLYLGGDVWHNGISQEMLVGQTLSKSGWRLLFTHHDQFVTPEVLSDIDLLIVLRTGAQNFLAWSTEGIVENRPICEVLTEEQDEAIINNIVNRGMGFIALHATCLFSLKEKYGNLMGIKTMMHGPVQTVRMHNFNQDHPITKGIVDFNLADDENFGVEIINKNVIPLYESTGQDDKRHDIAGWCIEAGKGRIVGLCAGHSYTAFMHPIYRQLHWRAAHWAMKKEIRPYDGPRYR